MIDRVPHAPANAIVCRFAFAVTDCWVAAMGDGSPDDPCGVKTYHVGMYDEPRSYEYMLANDKHYCSILDMMLRDSAHDVAVMAMQAETSNAWVCAAVPALLESDDPELDAIQRLRLAKRLAAAQANRALIDEARADLKRFVVDVHGATVPAIPPNVDDWITAAIERRDQNATDLLVHWIFANSPQSDDDPAVCRLTSMISKAARG